MITFSYTPWNRASMKSNEAVMDLFQERFKYQCFWHHFLVCSLQSDIDKLLIIIKLNESGKASTGKESLISSV